MKSFTAPDAAGVTAVTLAAFQFLRMGKAHGCRIVCTYGILLVTVSGEHRDFELHSGDTLVVPNDGLALIEAIGDSRLLLQERRRSAILRRLLPLRLRSGPVQQRSRTGVFSTNWF
jgi:hypothetical protein